MYSPMSVYMKYLLLYSNVFNRLLSCGDLWDIKHIVNIFDKSGYIPCLQCRHILIDIELIIIVNILNKSCYIPFHQYRRCYVYPPDGLLWHNIPYLLVNELLYLYLTVPLLTCDCVDL